MNKIIIYLILIFCFCCDAIIAITQSILAYIFGYCFGHFIYEIIRKKTEKEKIEEFFSAYNQKYGKQRSNYH